MSWCCSDTNTIDFGDVDVRLWLFQLLPSNVVDCKSNNELLTTLPAELFSSNGGVSHLHEACRIDELSRGSVLGLNF